MHFGIFLEERRRGVSETATFLTHEVMPALK